MRKSFTIICFLILSISCLFAINSGHYSDSFNISAYKIGGDIQSTVPHFELYVVDSIYDSFVPPAAEEGGSTQIDISDKVNNYLEDLKNPQARTTTFNADTMVFHVIAMGNQTGNYSLSISFGPLKNKNNVIKTAYTMGNSRINFENSESSITQDNQMYYVSQPIPTSWVEESEVKNVINTSPIIPAKNFTGIIENSEGNVEMDWAIVTESVIRQEDSYWDASWGEWKWKYKYSLSNTASPPWIARSAVAMSIDKTDYDTMPDGEYTAIVTVKFQQE